MALRARKLFGAFEKRGSWAQDYSGRSTRERSPPTPREYEYHCCHNLWHILGITENGGCKRWASLMMQSRYSMLSMVVECTIWVWLGSLFYFLHQFVLNMCCLVVRRIKARVAFVASDKKSDPLTHYFFIGIKACWNLPQSAGPRLLSA